MGGVTSSVVHLYAVIPEEDGARLRMRGVGLLRSGTTAAIVGSPPGFPTCARAALSHDRIVAGALRRCSGVVPFRWGVELRSEAEVYSLLRLNAAQLWNQLRRVHGRVEVGLKIRVAPPRGDKRLRLPVGLDRVHALAPQPEDRCERLSQGRVGTTFEGCYLISRRAVHEFWRVLDDLRRAAPQVPLLGSGPWAPYSFCAVPLRHPVGHA